MYSLFFSSFSSVLTGGTKKEKMCNITTISFVYIVLFRFLSKNFLLQFWTQKMEHHTIDFFAIFFRESGKKEALFDLVSFRG